MEEVILNNKHKLGLMKQAQSRNSIIVILDNIRSALNVGAIFRTCDAANVEKLCLCGITAYPPHNQIPKTALGAEKTVLWEYFKTTKDCISTFANSQIYKLPPKIVSIELTDNSTSLWGYRFPTPVALVFGNEISGVSEDILKASDAVVKIPMFGKKESLNVATTCGIVIYEVLRQWNEL